MIEYLDSRVNYKTISPEETIKNIRSILDRSSIFVIEKPWSDDEHFFSVKLRPPGMNIFGGGKGVNPKYALASAYAEFLERLQNLTYLNCNLHIHPQLSNNVVYPDATGFNYAVFKKKHMKILSKMFIYRHASELDVIARYEQDIIAYPYLWINKSKIEYLPYNLLYVSCVTNGMCAGNTFEEAIIQGICEIFERHILYRIHYDQTLKFPSVPETVIRQLPQWQYYQLLLAHGFEVYIKDCSMGGRFPVVCVIIKKGERALFNLGSAPDFSIALERCFTELFQDFDLNNINSKLQPIREFSSMSPGKNLRNELDKLRFQFYRSFRYGSGFVPPNLFDSSLPFDIKHLFQSRNIINKDTVNNLLDLVINKLNLDIFVRDISFMGFPTCHIYISGLSEILKVQANELEFIYDDIPRASKSFLNLKNIDGNEIRHLCGTMEKLFCYPYVMQESIMQALHNLPLHPGSKLNMILPEVVLSLLFYMTDDISSAYSSLKQYLDSLTPQILESHDFRATDIFCLFEFYRLRKEGLELNGIKGRLKETFVPEQLERIIQLLNEPGNIVDYFGIYEKRTDVMYQEYVSIQEKIIRLFKNYDFDQNKIRDLLS